MRLNVPILFVDWGLLLTRDVGLSNFIRSVGYFVGGNIVFSAAGYFYHYEKTKKLASLTVTIAVLNVLISYMLIPRFEVLGVAVGTLIAYILGWYSAHSFLRKKDKVQFAFYKSLIHK